MKKLICMILTAAIAVMSCACGTPAAPAETPFQSEAPVKETDSRAPTESGGPEQTGSAADTRAFSADLMRALLGTGGTENAVLSPANAYAALAMLAEVTDGESRQQILDALHADSIEELRAAVQSLLALQRLGEGKALLSMANSLWLSDVKTYRASACKALAERYQADSYTGRMGSKAFDRQLQKWLNGQTGGLLQDSVSRAHFREDTVLALASAVYLSGAWFEPFPEELTQTGSFYAADSTVQETDFLTEHILTGTVWFGDGYAAVRKYLPDIGYMWFILPDRDCGTAAVLRGTEMFDMLAAGWDWEQTEDYDLTVRVPKFDVSSDTDLVPVMEALGVRDVLDDSVSDFSPLTEEQGLRVTSAAHAARLRIDEKGVEAAAYTLIAACEGASLPEELKAYEFNADRPFLSVITDTEGVILFAAVINSAE